MAGMAAPRLPLYCAGDAAMAKARAVVTAAMDAYCTRVATVASLVACEGSVHEDVAALRAWLVTQRGRLAHAPALVQRRRLAALEEAAGEGLRSLQAQCRAEAQALAALPGHSRAAAAAAQVERLTRLSGQLSAAAAAAADAGEAKASRIAEAAHRKDTELRAAQAELLAVRSAEVAAQEARLAAAEGRLEQLLLQSGIAAARDALADVQQGQGTAAGESGRRLEDVAASALQQHLHARWTAADKSSATPTPPPWYSWAAGVEMGGPRVHLLRNVTLAMAGAELDAVVVVAEEAPLQQLQEGRLAGKFARQLHRTPPAACFLVQEVLAVAEVKSKSSDVLHSIPRLQSALSFLTNEAAPDSGPPPPFLHTAAQWTTWLYPRGSFAGTALHIETATKADPELGMEEAPARAFLFNAESRPFYRFHRNCGSGLFEEGVVYVTRDATIGLPSACSEQILHRVARTVDFDDCDDQCVAELQRWCEETMGETLRTVKEMAGHASRLHATDALLLSPLFPSGRGGEGDSDTPLDGTGGPYHEDDGGLPAVGRDARAGSAAGGAVISPRPDEC